MLNSVVPQDGLNAQEKEFWITLLQDLSPLHLPFQQNTPYTPNQIKTFGFLVERELGARLEELSKQYNTTVSGIMAATLKILLYRYTQQDDQCICTAYADTSAHEAGTGAKSELVLRSEINGIDTFSTVFEKLKAAADRAQSNQQTFREILQQLQPADPDAAAAVRQVLLLNKGLTVHSTHDNSPVAAFGQYLSDFDLIFTVSETALGLQGTVNYADGRFNDDMVASFAVHYKNLLIAVASDAGTAIGALEMLTATEKNDLLYKFNDTNVKYAATQTLQGIFEEQAAKTPDNIALRQHGDTMTYAELNAKANQLAAYLIEKGIKPKDNIGILVRRRFDMIVGMYAILKAGGAYVPVDPEYPEDRQQYILENSVASLVLTDAAYPIDALMPGVQFIEIQNIDLTFHSKENPNVKVNSQELAYTIYTSGSTGRPKGVMIAHHSAVNLCSWVNKEFNVNADDRLLFITSMCFDLSVYDIFGMLATGGSIVIAEQQEVTDLKALQTLMLDYGITFWDSVPTTLDYLVRDLENGSPLYLQNQLRLVFMSGDWIPVNLPDRIKTFFPKAKVISLGGATEGTVWSNFYPVEKVESHWKSIPYGRPMDNNYFYILNEQLQPVPVGVPGELYIGGVGVAKGYANDPEKTANSFKRDPFTNAGGGMMYKTGDLGRMMPDMNMEFIGRRDNQVKIRGFRIELGEIESVVRQSGTVNDVILMARDDKEGKKRLVAYIVPKSNFDKDALADFLRSKLPDYMVPSIWIKLEKLPLTSNGKIDKKALPDFDAETQVTAKYVAPQDDLEKEIGEIWQQVLGVSQIGMTDNFFDLGGHSLLAVQIVTKIGNKIGKTFPLAVLFRYPTVRALYEFIKQENAQTKWKTLVPIKPTGSKTPVYFIHGDGLNVLNFSSLAAAMDKDQPVYGIQAIGLDGIDEPLDDLEKIASEYLKEVLEQNPNGPYNLAGYSFGGYVGIEMRKQLLAMGRKVNVLAVFDTNSENVDYIKGVKRNFSKKVVRQVPKFFFIAKTFAQQPKATLQYQGAYFTKKLKGLTSKAGITKKPVLTPYFANLNRIAEKHFIAFKNYNFQPFDDVLHLFKAKKRMYFVDDFKSLGWQKWAKKGVKVYEVPGDHKTIFEQPNVAALAEKLQQVLDEN